MRKIAFLYLKILQEITFILFLLLCSCSQRLQQRQSILFWTAGRFKKHLFFYVLKIPDVWSQHIFYLSVYRMIHPESTNEKYRSKSINQTKKIRANCSKLYLLIHNNFGSNFLSFCMLQITRKDQLRNLFAVIQGFNYFNYSVTCLKVYV